MNLTYKELKEMADVEGVTLPTEQEVAAVEQQFSKLPEPHRSYSPLNEFVLQYAYRSKEVLKHLTIYIAEEKTPWYVKSWGPNMFTDMDDGYLGATDTAENLELWILS